MDGVHCAVCTGVLEQGQGSVLQGMPSDLCPPLGLLLKVSTTSQYHSVYESVGDICDFNSVI